MAPKRKENDSSAAASTEIIVKRCVPSIARKKISRTAQFTEIRSAINNVLLYSADNTGLPVPPLLDIITEYSVDLPVVSTWFSNFETQFAPQLNNAVAILSIQPLRFLITDSGDNVIHLCDDASGKISKFAGKRNGFDDLSEDGSISDCAFRHPSNLLVDQNNDRIFVAENNKIRIIKNGVVSTLIGDSSYGYVEGVGLAARLSRPHGMALTGNGESLIFCDWTNDLIRDVNLITCQTSAMAGDRKQENRDGRGSTSSIYHPYYCVWNRLTVKSQTELFITSRGSDIRRLDVITHELTTLKTNMKFDLRGIEQTPSGLLVISCKMSNCIYSIDPSNGAIVRLAGSESGEFGNTNGDPLTEALLSNPRGITVVESECCLAVVDNMNIRIRKVPLPSHLFLPHATAETDE